MATKRLGRLSMVGALTTLAGSAAVLVRRNHQRVRAELRALPDDTTSPTAGNGNGEPPAPDPEAELPAHVYDWDCADLTAPMAVSASDLEYYQTCWRHILGTFAHWPAVGLDLAETLTANLMLNRGVVPRGCEQPAELPYQWTFATAQGYREAQSIAARADTEDLPRRELSKALLLYRAMFEDVLTAPTPS